MAEAEPFDVSIERDAASVRVLVAGELDLATVPELLAVFEGGAVDPAAAVVLDLTRVSFIGGSGLRALLAIHELAGARLLIVPGATARRLLAVTGVAHQLPIAAPDA
jgi:anti-anti-sigma factor